MLVSGGKILALGKVSADNTLKGLGTPDSPLGINNPEQYAQKEWVENTFVSADYLEKNYWTSGQVEERIHQIPGATNYSAGKNISKADIEHYIVSVEDSAFAPYATKDDVEREYAKKTDLSPYALTSAVNQKFNETSSWANSAFQPKGDYATKTDVSNASAAAVNSADGIIKYWVQHNYWTSGETQHVMEEMLANFGGYKFTQAGADGKPVLPQGEEPSNKKIYLTENTSAAGLDRYFNWIYKTDTQDYICVGDTSVDLEGYAKTDWVSGELDKKVNTADFNSYKTDVEHALADKLDKSEFDAYSAGIATALGNKLDKDDFEAWSAHAFDDYAKTNDVNAKFDETSAWAKGTFVSANEFTEYKNTVADALAGKLDKSDFNTYSGGIDDDLRNISASLDNKLNRSETTEWDVTPYIGTEGIKVDAETHEISVSADFVTSQELQTSLEGYYTKDQTSGAQALADEFAKYQPSGNYITSTAADEKYIQKTWSAEKDFTPYSGGEGIKIEDHTISLSSVPQTVQLTSEDESVTINTDGPDEHGVITYDLSVPAPAAEVNISGENGVSAKYDAEASAWKIGLEEQTYEYLEAKETDTTTVTAAKQVLNNFDTVTTVGSNIDVVDGQITFGNTGLYHIDMQVDVTVADTDLSYYTVLLELANYSNPTIGATIKATTHEIDWSYEHTETINVSFDFKVNNTGTDTAVVISQLPLQGKASVRVRNLNIHEVVTIDKVVEAALPTYSEGTAIAIQDSLDGKFIGVHVGLGLSANPLLNTLNVACGSGLKIDKQGGVMAVTLDEMTEEVVETVQEMQKDMESKITTNFPQAGITHVNSYVPGGTESQYQSTKGFVYGNLFNITMNHKIEIGKTYLGVYCKQNNNKNKYILGIYEYQPDYERKTPGGEISGYGRTVAKCDTGFVEILPGFHEYQVKHLNNTIGTADEETNDTMSTNNFYYAAIFFPNDRNGEQSLWLGSAPGYNTQLNECKPQLLCSFNNIPAGVNTSYSADLSFNDFGFTWAYDDYTQKTTYHQDASAHECYDSLRFFMQIRNHQ